MRVLSLLALLQATRSSSFGVFGASEVMNMVSRRICKTPIVSTRLVKQVGNLRESVGKAPTAFAILHVGQDDTFNAVWLEDMTPTASHDTHAYTVCGVFIDEETNLEKELTSMSRWLGKQMGVDVLVHMDQAWYF